MSVQFRWKPTIILLNPELARVLAMYQGAYSLPNRVVDLNAAFLFPDDISWFFGLWVVCGYSVLGDNGVAIDFVREQTGLPLPPVFDLVEHQFLIDLKAGRNVWAPYCDFLQDNYPERGKILIQRLQP